MTESAARELYDLHLAADRSSPASLPLRSMAWLWEQSVRAADPSRLGAPSPLFALLTKLTPNMNWAGWLNSFLTPGFLPKGASIGDVVLKLYDTGILNQRTFWTSDLGAAVGGAKRRAIIAGVLELGVEVFSFVEGIHGGFISWDGDIRQLAGQYRDWRDQPKYLNMRLMAQGTASAGSASRAMLRGDILGLNYPSMILALHHLWVRPAVGRRHMERLVRFSQEDSGRAVAAFEEKTGVLISPTLRVIQGGAEMDKSLDARLIAAGCQSTRVRVLAHRRPEVMASVVERFESLSKKVAGDATGETSYDHLCEAWYLADEVDDAEALAKLLSDLKRVEASTASAPTGMA